MGNEQSIYLEKGETGHTNQRFINQVALSSVASFVPAPIAADNSTMNQLIDKESLSLFGDRRHSYSQNDYFKYPVERISGPQWQSFLDSSQIFWEEMSVRFTFKDHILVALQVIEQLRYLWENFGIVLADRNATNIILKPSQEADQDSQPRWHVYQVDVEYVYDAINDTHTIDKSVLLRDRMGKFSPRDIKNIGMAHQYISHAVRDVLKELINVTKQAEYADQISPQQKQLISFFSTAWNFEEKTGTLASVLYLDFETALDFLKKLLGTEKTALFEPNTFRFASLIERIKRLFIG